MARLDRAASAALLLAPGALIVYFGFVAGGYFAGAPAVAAVAVALILLLRVMTAEQPFAGIGWPGAVTAGALALFAIWTLVSGTWSDAPGRATVEFDRALLYALVFLLFVSVPREPGTLAWVLKGLVAGIAIVCIAGLASRVAPDIFPVEPGYNKARLSYPLSYWNGLGLLAATGITLCLHLSSSLREPPWARVGAAALAPALAATLLLTLSRGAMAVLAVALLTYALLGRPRGLLSGVIAVGPATAVAMVAAYRADELTSQTPTSPAAVEQGHDLAMLVIACVFIAAAVRMGLLALDQRLAARARRVFSPKAVLGGAAAALLVAFAAATALGAPSYVERQYDRFVNADVIGERVARERLTTVGNKGRVDHWKVSLDGFESRPLSGTGAGTFPHEWSRERPTTAKAFDGHSLYLEVLGELGLVGLILLLAAILVALVTLALRSRGSERSLCAALFAVCLAWALHAGVDWDWELPGVSAWVFALAGAGMAVSRPEQGLASHPLGSPGS